MIVSDEVSKMKGKSIIVIFLDLALVTLMFSYVALQLNEIILSGSPTSSQDKIFFVILFPTFVIDALISYLFKKELIRFEKRLVIAGSFSGFMVFFLFTTYILIFFSP